MSNRYLSEAVSNDRVLLKDVTAITLQRGLMTTGRARFLNLVKDLLLKGLNYYPQVVILALITRSQLPTSLLNGQ